ncbi:hypothetical protein EMIT036CA2_50416 [Chryseobacterium sp. IT-36CA2]
MFLYLSKTLYDEIEHPDFNRDEKGSNPFALIYLKGVKI